MISSSEVKLTLDKSCLLSQQPTPPCTKWMFWFFNDECLLHSRTVNYLKLVDPELRKRIFGQDIPLGILKNIFLTRFSSKVASNSGIGFNSEETTEKKKPIVIHLVGDNGTGKSLTIETLCDYFYLSYKGLKRDKMSAILSIRGITYKSNKYYYNKRNRDQHAHELSEDLKMKIIKHVTKYTTPIIVIEEIQKMMPEVFVTLETFFDDKFEKIINGVSYSREMKDVIFILTSDLGAEDSTRDVMGDETKLNKKVHETMKNYTLKHNFNHKMTHIIFRPLLKEHIKKILEREVNILICRLTHQSLNERFYEDKKTSNNGKGLSSEDTFQNPPHKVLVDFITEKDEILNYYGEIWSSNKHIRGLNGRAVEKVLKMDFIYNLKNAFDEWKNNIFTTKKSYSVIKLKMVDQDGDDEKKNKQKKLTYEIITRDL